MKKQKTMLPSLGFELGANGATPVFRSHTCASHVYWVPRHSSWLLGTWLPFTCVTSWLGQGMFVLVHPC